MRAKSGDQDATEALIASLSGLVYRTALGFRCRSHGLEDLYQEGVLGLLRAIRDFDPDLGNRLSTYCTYWIYRSINRAVTENDRLIRFPVQAQAELRRLASAEALLGPKPTDREVAEVTGLTEQRVYELNAFPEEPRSLDGGLTAGEECSPVELLADPDAIDPQQRVCEEAKRELVCRALQQLTALQKRVIVERFGLTGQPPGTLKQIATGLGVSGERVRQIELQAVRRLGSICDAGELPAPMRSNSRL